MWACTRDHEIKFASKQREELLATTRDLTLFWLLLAHVFCQERFQKVIRTAVALQLDGMKVSL